MKIFSSEFGHNYNTYSFAYTIYAKLEAGDSLDNIYSSGFLPFSGAKNILDTFYMARSVRSYVKGYTPTSENRRVLKKFDNEFSKNILTPEEAVNSENFFTLCLNYFNLAHGSVMPRERLEQIFKMNLITKVIEYSKDNTPVAYLLIVEGEKFSHYWFSFYKEEYIKTSLGMWLALDYIRDMQNTEKEYFYFGTCYAAKALYKTNVEPLEYWNGQHWSKDIKKLKDLCRTDENRIIENRNDIYKSELELF